MSLDIKTFKQLEEDYNSLREEEDVEKFFQLTTTFLKDIELYSANTEADKVTNKFISFLNDNIRVCQIFLDDRNRNSLLALLSLLECERGGVFELVKIYDVFEDINQETSLELEKYIKIGKILKESDFVKAIDTTIQKE